jgi:hypothetical protein
MNSSVRLSPRVRTSGAAGTGGGKGGREDSVGGGMLFKNGRGWRQYSGSGGSGGPAARRATRPCCAPAVSDKLTLPRLCVAGFKRCASGAANPERLCF